MSIYLKKNSNLQINTDSQGTLVGLKGGASLSISGADLRAADRTKNNVLRADFIVYGATFSGIMAACQAASMGVSALLIAHNGRIGGMVTGGLSRTDSRGFSARTCMNNMTAEFYRRCAAAYGMTLGQFGMDATSPFATEPKVAMAILKDMLNEYSVPVLYDYRVTSVAKQAGGISYIDLAHRKKSALTKRVFGKIFSDSSYSTDLLIRSGVSYTYGREANATYGETYNGVTAPFAHTGNPSPYVISGNAGSGLLPYIDAAPLETAGTADNRLQAFCHRLIMTNDPSNRLPIPEPDVYNPLWFEVLGRSMAASPSSYNTLDKMFYRAPIPLGGTKKEDWNSTGSFSLDFVGGNVGFVTTDYAQQDLLVLNGTRYTLGLFKFLREDSRVPAVLKTALADWGFCADEFVGEGTAGLSPEWYVREAARMVGDYVMTEANFFKTAVAVYPVVGATYPMDSHLCSRRNVGGIVKSEGGLSSNTVPVGYYGVEYRALLPKSHECSNLLATFGLSASHTVFGSLRMEITFGSVGEAAGAAAALAIRGKQRLHDLSGADIQAVVRPYTLNPMQVLTLQNGNPNGAATAYGSITTSSVAGWTTGVTFPPEFYGTGMWHDGNGNKGGRFVQFHPKFGTAGRYRILLNAPGATNSQRKAKVDIRYINNAGVAQDVSFFIDHKYGEWHFRDLGVWRFADDGSSYIKVTNAGDPADPGSDVGLLNIDGVGWIPTP